MISLRCGFFVDFSFCVCAVVQEHTEDLDEETEHDGSDAVCLPASRGVMLEQVQN